MMTGHTTWSLIAHAKLNQQRQLHQPLAATAGPIAAPDETHIGIDAAVAVPEAEIHIRTAIDGEKLAGVLDGGTLIAGIEIVGIEVAIGMTVEEIGIAVVEMIGMSRDDEEGICVSIGNIQAYSKHPVYKMDSRVN
jgi:hypothetical protein